MAVKVYTHKSYKYVTIAEMSNAEIEQIKIHVCNQPRETLETWYKRQTDKPAVVINGGLFMFSSGNPCGTLVVDGKTYASSATLRDGMGTSKLNQKELIADVFDNRKWTDFINGYPVLIKGGKAVAIKTATELNYKTRRTVLGYGGNKVYMVCVDNPGMAYAELQALCLDIGMRYAINLDGGGSTRMLVHGVRKTKLATNRAVDNVIAVYTEVDSKEVDYYVRTKVASLNIRTGPGASSYALNGKIAKNTECHIIAEAVGESGSAPLWGKLDDGRGWIAVSDSYVTKVSTDNQSTFAPYKAKINTAVLRIRSGPSTTYKQVGSKRQGNIVTILEEKDGWGRLGANMWIILDYIVRVE